MQHPFHSCFTATIAAASILLGTHADAAIMSVDAVTLDGTDTIQSVTIGGVSYSNLLGATSASSATSDYYYRTSGSDPGSVNAALAGLRISDGALNSGATFQFGTPIGLDQTLFLMDIDTGAFGDVVQIRPVDSSGDFIGDYTFTIADERTNGDGNGNESAMDTNGFGPALLTYKITTSTSGALTFDFRVHGFSFTLADLTGTTGDLSQATGFTVINADGDSVIDPAVGGLIIPEPGSAALIGFACSMLIGRRRQ